MTSTVIKLLLRHGQIPLVYPGAFFLPKSYSHRRIPGEIFTLTTSDKVELRAYLLRQTHSKGSVLMFHGNGMVHTDLREIAEIFLKEGFDVLLPSYRGYAGSRGVPSEKGLQRDAQASLDYLLENEPYNSKPIIIYGLSLGGAVGLDLCSRNPSKIHSIIVENTFKSLPAVVRGWPYIGWIASVLLSQKWNSMSRIPKIPAGIPILVLSGTHDVVVPPKHSDEIWQLVQARHSSISQSPSDQVTSETSAESNKSLDMFQKVEWGDHADTWTKQQHNAAVKEFLQNVLAPDVI